MARLYRTTFEVGGVSAFPIDMLRYDECFPSDNDAIGNIQLSFESEIRRTKMRNGTHFKVRLVSLHMNSAWQPTEERWRSFGWFVVKGSVTKRPA